MSRMTETQRDFFVQLQAPFPKEAITNRSQGGKELSWVDARRLANRLDTVCGPMGWDVAYEATARGYKAKLGILCPVANGEWAWIYKEDGAGFEEMGAQNKQTGEFECDVDNDEKSAYTNAFRRVCQIPWGIGRHLYAKGMPYYIDDALKVPRTPHSIMDDEPSDPNAANAKRSRPLNEQPAAPATPAPPAPKPAPSPAPAAPKPMIFKLPKAGRGVFAWAKDMEKHYETSFINGMLLDGERITGTRTILDWTQAQVDEILVGVVGHLRALLNYNGEYGYDDGAQTGGGAPAPALPPRAVEPALKGTGNPGVAVPPSQELVDARSNAAAAITTLLTENLGRKPEMVELKKAVATISPRCANGGGELEHVMTSIGGCNDAVWLQNLTVATVDLISLTREKSSPPEDQIPF